MSCSKWSRLMRNLTRRTFTNKIQWRHICTTSVLNKGSPDVISFTHRSDTCGSLRETDIGKKVCLCGWVQYRRADLFLVLRDWHGLTQAIIPEHMKPSIESVIDNLTYETVVEVTGIVQSRPTGQENKEMPTGMVEVAIDDLKVLSQCTPTLPFVIREFHEAKESLRMEYRYLDFRFKQMQRNLRLRSKMIMKMREFLVNLHNFVDIETPTLFRRTPGGAKEFIVPSHHPGKFYCLPQSPQQFKQLLMVGGFDRYFQIARCYRDEGSKPDRQPEFTQLDIEMSFVAREGVLTLVEQLLQHSWPENLPTIDTPFPHLTYEQAMRLYGMDKPDTRFDWKICDVREIMQKGNLQMFEAVLADAERTVTALQIPGGADHLSISKLENLLKEVQFPGSETVLFLPIKILDNRWKCRVSRHIQSGLKDSLTAAMNIQKGDLLLLAAGKDFLPHQTLGRLRLKIADILEQEGVKVRDKDTFNFLWVVDFPMFLSKEDGEGLESAHHPFTAAHPDDQHLLQTQPDKVRSQHYDLVLNGNEVGGGSIRIHDPETQKYVLEEVLKEDSSELQHLLEALSMGCPPHGGIALGLDRLFAILCGAESIRDVIAFPKTYDGKDPMSKAPAPVSQADLDSFCIQVKLEAEDVETSVREKETSGLKS